MELTLIDLKEDYLGLKAGIQNVGKADAE